jgi:hypothetical protein
MKNCKSFNLTCVLLIFSIINISTYAQNSLPNGGVGEYSPLINSLNSFVVNQNGYPVQNKNGTGYQKQMSGEEYFYAINKIAKAIKNGRTATVPDKKKYSLRDDIYMAFIIEDVNNTPDNKSDDAYDLLVTTKYGLLADFKTFHLTTKTQNTPRYFYKTVFYIGRLMETATFSKLEYLISGNFGEDLEKFEYTFDHVTEDSMRGETFTLDPGFMGVLTSMTITGN